MGRIPQQRRSANGAEEGADDHCTTQWAVRAAGPWAGFEHAGVAKLKVDPSREVYPRPRRSSRNGSSRRSRPELGMIMPPIGINVLVINSLARDVPLWTISKGVMPFILSDLVRLTLLVAFPISPFLPWRM